MTRDKSKEPDTYWAGDTTGKNCDVIGCTIKAKITRHTKTDEKVRLCYMHQHLDPDAVMESRTQVS